MGQSPKPLIEHTDEFIGIICHELRTPLTLLTAIMQLLRRKLDNAEDITIHKSLTKAEDQLIKMENLINSFLNVCFLENGKPDIDLTTFNLSLLIGEIVNETRALLKNQFIILDCCDTIILNADRTKIGCVLSNLLCNAIKYSPDSKKIYIKCFKAKEKVIVRVRDEGIGIKSENLDRLFERFFRIDNSESSKVEGFGLGLYLCSAIIKQHNGEIWAESDYGKGATFSFSLPLN